VSTAVQDIARSHLQRRNQLDDDEQLVVVEVSLYWHADEISSTIGASGKPAPALAKLTQRQLPSGCRRAPAAPSAESMVDAECTSQSPSTHTSLTAAHVVSHDSDVV